MRVSQPKHPGKTPKKLNNIKMPSVHKRTRTLKEEEEKKRDHLFISLFNLPGAHEHTDPRER